MELAFPCSGCQKQLKVSGDKAGTSVPCDCGAETEAPPLRLGPGLVLGGFLLEKHLGKGAMGDVFLGRQLSMDRVVAVKTLPAQMTLNEEAVGRFLNEVQITAQMSHPNIVTAFDAGEDEGTYFFAMAFVDGQDFKKLVEDDGPLDEARTLEVVRDVSRALRYAWEEFTILHRDVKPENIMIDRHDTVRLMDMGISKAMNQDGGMTVEGMVVGTPHYMSPEQAWSEDPPDFRADMYSVGATAYFLLTGSPPYRGTVQSVFQMLAKPEPIQPIRQANPKISAPAAILIDTMLSPDPDHRHENWGAFLEDLDRVRGGKMPSHRRPTAPGQTGMGMAAAAAPTGPIGDTMTFSLKKLGGEEENDFPDDDYEPPEASAPQPIAAPAEPEAPEEIIEAAPPPPPPPPAPEKSPLRLANRPEEPAPAAPIAPPAPGEAALTDEDADGGSGKKMIIAIVATVVIVGSIISIIMTTRSNDKPPNQPPPTTVTTPTTDAAEKAKQAAARKKRREEKAAAALAAKKNAQQNNKSTPTATVETPNTKPAARWVPISAGDRESMERKVASAIADAEKTFKVNKQKLAARLKLPWPLPPTKARAEIDKMLAAKIAEQVDAKLPPRTLEEYMAPALQRHGPHQIGTEVRLTLRYGKGTLSGTLRQVGTRDFKVDDQVYPLHHLETADRERMSEVTAKAKAETVAKGWFSANEERRNEMIDTVREEIEGQIYKTAGLIKKKGTWSTATELMDAEIDLARTRQLKEASVDIRKEIYEAAGYNERGGLWGKMSE